MWKQNVPNAGLYEARTLSVLLPNRRGWVDPPVPLRDYSLSSSRVFGTVEHNDGTSLNLLSCNGAISAQANAFCFVFYESLHLQET